MHMREPENPAKRSTPAKSPYQPRSPDASVAEAEIMSLNIPTSALNPPGIQRVVMEHVVRTSDSMTSSHVSFCLKAFSGRIPRPSHEPDFDTCRASVDFLLNDQSLSDLHKTGKVLDSLLPPASDVVKHVAPFASALECLKLLESVYGSVEDGDELFAKFIGALQNQGEKPSTYLHRLHVMLSAAIRRGGVAEAERNRCLLKQFCRGCWDNSLITDLQLEGKRVTPLSFTEFVVLVRIAEDKQSLKEERMKKHLGLNRHAPVPLKLRASAKQKSAKSKSKVEKSEVEILKKEVSKLQTQISMMKTEPVCKERRSPTVEEFSELRHQIAELQANFIPRLQRERQEKSPALHTFPAKHQTKPMGPEMNTSFRPIGQFHSRPRPGYCFHCGDDGHLAVNCENDSNSHKVEEKRRELRERQAKWDLQNASNLRPLN
nr:zinc finger CCHC domain-containing protein 12-like [Paramormyrops kingsleyae]